ncbi:hypothetical protein AB6A40_006280 [Gnathostoma spinigerum]|uniref:Uncharacterized protein n=1 Tax=Gnathostoma spinigerum TaxID=75299 RepID=A0ABD6EQ72_9BILA
MDQKIIDYIKEHLDENLDRECDRDQQHQSPVCTTSSSRRRYRIAPNRLLESSYHEGSQRPALRALSVGFPNTTPTCEQRSSWFPSSHHHYRNLPQFNVESARTKYPFMDHETPGIYPETEQAYELSVCDRRAPLADNESDFSETNDHRTLTQWQNSSTFIPHSTNYDRKSKNDSESSECINNRTQKLSDEESVSNSPVSSATYHNISTVPADSSTEAVESTPATSPISPPQPPPKPKITHEALSGSFISLKAVLQRAQPQASTSTSETDICHTLGPSRTQYISKNATASFPERLHDDSQDHSRFLQSDPRYFDAAGDSRIYDDSALVFDSIADDVKKMSNASTEAPCMPPIVTAIDSNRESDIIQSNFPRRSSSKKKVLRCPRRGFDVIIRTQNPPADYIDEVDQFSRSEPYQLHPTDATPVTEF